MLKKIDIQSFGLFKEYKWNTHIGNDLLNDIFKRINIIYGRNYSGKTTLSRIFRWIETGHINEKYTGSQFSISHNDSDIISETNLSSPYKIRVYNTDFIKVNLSWLYDNENGEIRPFTLLGSGNIEATNRIEEIDKELGSAEEQTGLFLELEEQNKIYNEINSSLRKKEIELDELLQKQANQKIKTNPYYVLQGENYNVTNIRNEVKEIGNNAINYILDEKVASLHKAIIDETEKVQLGDIQIKVPNYIQYLDDVKLLIEKKITLSKTIQELVNDSLLQKWVDEGRNHHRNKLTECAFCGGTITPERWSKIDAHFSKESEELKRAIENEESILEESKNYINNFLETENIIKENYYSSFSDEFDEIRTMWDTVVEKHVTFINLLIEELQKRYNDIFNPKTIEKIAIPNLKIEDIINSINILSEKNNNKSTTLGEDKKKSRKLLRYSENARFLSEIDYIKKLQSIDEDKKKLPFPQKVIEDLRVRITTLEDEKKQEKLKLNDEGEAAKKINNHLKDFFGHDGLSLIPEVNNGEETKTKFVVKRGDEKAYNLSEGECSLISFCYFIAKMEDELNSTDNEYLIIYIDDPISSLDSNHIFFMFSLIETVIAKDKKYAQLFISTHNLDFLKYVKRLTIPRDANNKEQVNHFIVEKKKKDKEYRCFLSKMPNYLKDYVTEYNFLFKEIYSIARPFTRGERVSYFENNFTLLYNLPNNMRRFLECYLFYRFPNTDDPLKNLKRIFCGNIPALVNRIINEYSHLTWGDRGTLVMDISEAETVAKEIMKAIMKDKEHFEALCDSIGVDKNIDLV